MEKRVIHIVLADCYHDSDKGGGGIVVGAVNTLRQVCARHGYSVELSLLYRFSRDDPRFASANRLTAKVYPDVQFLPAPISSRHGPGLHWVSFFLRAFVIAPLRLLVPWFALHGTVTALRRADVIVSKGGNFFRSWSKKPWTDALAMYLLTYHLILCARLRKDFCVFSHSFGPFKTAIAERIIRSVLLKACYVSCRERISKDILVRCGLAAERVNVDCDFGFAVVPADDRRADAILAKYELTPNQYVAVTARPWFQEQRRLGDETGYNAYVEGMAALGDYIVDAHNLAIALVVQNDGAHSRNEPDEPVLNDVYQSMRNKRKARIMNDDFTAQELVSIYARASLTLGTRLHSCIFSFTVGTPAIAVAYAHKAKGIMGLMNAAEYVLDIEKLDVKKAKKMIDEIITHRPVLSTQYKERVEEIRQQLVESVDRVLSDQLLMTAYE